MMPEAWPSIRSMARCVLPVFVGPRTAFTRAGKPESRPCMDECLCGAARNARGPGLVPAAAFDQPECLGVGKGLTTLSRTAIVRTMNNADQDTAMPTNVATR